MKIKDEKQKHNHKLTDLLKVCIFGLLMIAPLLASVSQMLYVTLNKNAKDSYYGQTINETQENSTPLANLQINIEYIWTKQTYTTNNSFFHGINFYISSAYRNDTLLEYDYFRFYANTNSTVSMVFYNSNASNIQTEIYSTTNDIIKSVEYAISFLIDR